jgi:ATP-dependent Clp protease ATP-binding subunit ClpB
MDSFNPTTKTQQTVSIAVAAAMFAGRPDIGPVHLLGALLALADGITTPLLQAAGADPTAILTEVTVLRNQLPSFANGSNERAVATGMLWRC